MKLQYEINPENLKVLEIKQIALDKDKFGVLTFDKAYPQLHDLRKTMVEFEELGYRELLTPDEVSDIDSYRGKLLEFINQIHSLNPEDGTFNKAVRDQIENEVDGYYRSTIKALRSNLVFLRQEAARKSQDTQSLAEQQKNVGIVLKQAQDTSSQLQQKLEELQKREQQIANTSGQIGAEQIGFYFQQEVKLYQSRADRWFKIAIVAYLFLVGSVLIAMAYYSFFRLGGWTSISWQEGAAKLFFFTALWYGLAFVIRNFGVNSHLAAVNRHRAAVARTLNDFLAANPTATGEMLQHGTDAMFKHAPIGFITKAEKESSNPLFEIANKIVNPKSE